MNTGGRPRTGGLFWRNGRAYARLTVDRDGVSVRVVRALNTDSKQVANAKLARLLGSEIAPEEASRGETFEEAARRVAKAQIASGKRSWEGELARLEEHVFDALGPMLVKDIRARHITEALQNVTVQVRGSDERVKPSRQTLKNILSAVSVVLDDLWRKEQLTENVAKRVKLPKSDRPMKERAVLTDFELVRYLRWEHPHGKPPSRGARTPDHVLRRTALWWRQDGRLARHDLAVVGRDERPFRVRLRAAQEDRATPATHHR